MRSGRDNAQHRVTGLGVMGQITGNAGHCAEVRALWKDACTCGRERGLCATCRAWLGLRARLQRRMELAHSPTPSAELHDHALVRFVRRYLCDLAARGHR